MFSLMLNSIYSNLAYLLSLFNVFADQFERSTGNAFCYQVFFVLLVFGPSVMVGLLSLGLSRSLAWVLRDSQLRYFLVMASVQAFKFPLMVWNAQIDLVHLLPLMHELMHEVPVDVYYSVSPVFGLLRSWLDDLNDKQRLLAQIAALEVDNISLRTLVNRLSDERVDICQRTLKLRKDLNVTRIELTKAKAQVANVKKRSAAQREEAQRTQYSTRLGVAVLGVQRECARQAMIEAKNERNEAKRQREEAKRQRDEAKKQRDNFKRELDQARMERDNALSQRDEAKEDKKALKKKLRAFIRSYDALEFVSTQLAQSNKDARHTFMARKSADKVLILDLERRIDELKNQSAVNNVNVTSTSDAAKEPAMEAIRVHPSGTSQGIERSQLVAEEGRSDLTLQDEQVQSPKVPQLDVQVDESVLGPADPIAVTTQDNVSPSSLGNLKTMLAGLNTSWTIPSMGSNTSRLALGLSLASGSLASGLLVSSPLNSAERLASRPSASEFEATGSMSIPNFARVMPAVYRTIPTPSTATLFPTV